MSDYPTSINLCDGKYTIIYDFATGQSECLRYGQPWRQLVGDKMVLACFDEIVRLRAELAAAQATKEQMREALKRCTKFTQEDYDALALQPCPEVLNKVRADAVAKFAKHVDDYEVDKLAAVYIKRIEQEEA